jgi:hypothetical protein
LERNCRLNQITWKIGEDDHRHRNYSPGKRGNSDISAGYSEAVLVDKNCELQQSNFSLNSCHCWVITVRVMLSRIEALLEMVFSVQLLLNAETIMSSLSVENSWGVYREFLWLEH